MENNSTKVRLIPDVKVKQFVNRTASTGRKMHSVKILIPVEGVSMEWGFLRGNTPWADMPYKLRAWELKRIKAFTEAMILAQTSIEDIRWGLYVLYDAGIPKLQNCSDWERFEKHHARNVARNGMVYMSSYRYGHRTELIDGEWRSVDAEYGPLPKKRAQRKTEEA